MHIRRVLLAILPCCGGLALGYRAFVLGIMEGKGTALTARARMYWFGRKRTCLISRLDEASGLPVWVQILRNRFIYLIKTGHYAPGDQAPSVRSLAAEISINYNTVSKAYVDLEHAGYVVSVRGRGVFVRDVPATAREDMLTSVDTVLEDAIRRCVSMGLTLDEVKAHIRRCP